MHIDSGTLARTRFSSPGPIGLNEIEPNTALDNSKRELAFDIGQLILDITGIFDPSPISDGTSFLISLARGNWFDAATSAVSIVPYIGDLAKTAKLPRYLESVRKAIQIARLDFEWAHALQALFEKLKKVLDKGYELSADLLPDAARNQLKALKDEIDDFLKPRGSAAGNLPEGGIKTKPQSSKPIKSKGDLEQPKPADNLDKNATKGHGGNENNVGPKKTTESKTQSKPNPDKAPDAEIPGVDRPFRSPHPDHPPNKNVTSAMDDMEIRWDTDCSEIADDLYKAADGQGSIIKVTGKGDLKLLEYGKIESGMKFHEVFTDGKYIYDPRLSSTPVPKGDWANMIKQLNPGANIK